MASFRVVSMLRKLSLMVLCSHIFGAGILGDHALRAAESGPQFIASITPVAMILKEMLGPQAQVSVLLSPGASPHTFEPAPSDLRRLAGGAVLVFVGKNLDDWAIKLGAKTSLGLLTLLPKAEQVFFSDHDNYGAHDEHNEKEHVHAAGSIDPHFWLNPKTVSSIVPGLRDFLCSQAPLQCGEIKSHAQKFQKKLDDLAKDLTIRLALLKGQHFVLFHLSFNYLFKVYGLKLVASIEPSLGKESSLRFIA